MPKSATADLGGRSGIHVAPNSLRYGSRLCGHAAQAGCVSLAGMTPRIWLLVDIRRVRPLVELDIGAPRIGNESKRGARALLRVGPVELDAGGFELRDEGLEVLHVEADVVEGAALGRDGRRVRLVEPQLRARNVGDRRIVARRGLGAENLAVPGLDL